MSENILKFNKTQAGFIIERFKKDLWDRERDAENNIPGNLGPSDYAFQIEILVDNATSLAESAGYDIRVTAQALEEVENEYESALNTLRLYVILYRDTDEARREERAEKNVTDITVSLLNKVDELIRRLDEAEEEKRRRKEEREKRKREQEDLEEEYRKTRENLQRQISRRRKAGVDMPDVSVPDIPQKITRGSINRLQSIIDYIQDEYRYLDSRRGYRHQRK